MAAAPKHWADMDSPTSQGAGEKSGMRTMTMVDVRRTWARFGAAVENDANLTVVEKPVFLELGSIDKIEKESRDEVFDIMARSLQAKVPEGPKGRELRAFDAKAKLETTTQQTASSLPSSPTSMGPSSMTTTASGQKKTWADARKERTGGAPGSSGPAMGGPSSAAATRPSGADGNVIRICNLGDDITLEEIRRIFGPDNGLGDIKRVFIAKDAEGNRRGYAYVTYGSSVDANKAVEKMHKKAFKHVVLLVDYGTPNPKAATPGAASAPPRR
jgi:hypothetical protein